MVDFSFCISLSLFSKRDGPSARIPLSRSIDHSPLIGSDFDTFVFCFVCIDLFLDSLLFVFVSFNLLQPGGSPSSEANPGECSRFQVHIFVFVFLCFESLS